VLLLAPHFVGLDMGGVRVAIAWRTASMYGKQKNPALDAAMRHGRERFGDPVLISRQDGIRPVVRALRDGFAFYYLPDMDFGPRESIFVPFFGVTTATVPALAAWRRSAARASCPSSRASCPTVKAMPRNSIRRGKTSRPATSTPTRGA
jgi:KDO2-lipid IV(A) lauroyltransferase